MVNKRSKIMSGIRKINDKRIKKVARLKKQRKKLKMDVELFRIRQAVKLAKTKRITMQDGLKVIVHENRSIFVVDENGEMNVPLPVGKFKTKDGKLLIIKVEGQLFDITDIPPDPKSDRINKELGLLRKYQFQTI